MNAGLVVRPIDGHTDMTIKLRFMQFLSRINEGDKLGNSNVILFKVCLIFLTPLTPPISHCQFLFTDVTFQKPLTPLESALSVLESICTEVDVAQEILEKVHTSIREMVRSEKSFM